MGFEPRPSDREATRLTTRPARNVIQETDFSPTYWESLSHVDFICSCDTEQYTYHGHGHWLGGGLGVGGRCCLMAMISTTALAAQRWNSHGRGGIRSCLIPSFVAFYWKSINLFSLYLKKKKTLIKKSLCSTLRDDYRGHSRTKLGKDLSFTPPPRTSVTPTCIL